MRVELQRKTKETEVKVSLSHPGSGNIQIDTPVGFLNHMLTLLAWNMGADLTLWGSGDVHVDYHHLVEDIGIVLGRAFKELLGDKSGISRYGDVLLPMDEALAMVAVDISGRPYLVFDVKFPVERIKDFDVELFKEFFRAFVNEARITLHIRLLSGENAHHIAEAVFKGVGRSISYALVRGGEGVPSTKGVIE